jgi:heterogeneous nuclear rnp K-like protein 2
LEDDGVNNTTSKLAVPSELVGSIIGPGGKVINQIRAESNAKIHITAQERNRKDRDVFITGSLEAISKALKSLHHYLAEEQKRKEVEEL